jgi:phage repressor protein C with HTH and peptisase S24 domain
MTRIPPMEFLGPAVRQLRKDRGLTLEAVANQVTNYDSGNLSRFERGIQSIDADKLQEIATLLGKTVSEIYGLAEQMEKASKPPAIPLAHSVSEAHPNYSPGSVVALVPSPRLQSPSGDKRPSFEGPASGEGEFVLIPSAAVVTDSQGQSVVGVNAADERLPMPKVLFKELGISAEQARLVKVHDDAMHPALSSGDTALVDTGETAVQSGRVYAVLVQDEIWVRRVMKTPTGMILSADNKSARFEDFTMSIEAFSAIQVIGRVRIRWGSSGL